MLWWTKCLRLDILYMNSGDIESERTIGVRSSAKHNNRHSQSELLVDEPIHTTNKSVMRIGFITPPLDEA